VPNGDTVSVICGQNNSGFLEDRPEVG